MVEVAELSLRLDGELLLEEVDADAAPCWSPRIAPASSSGREIRHRLDPGIFLPVSSPHPGREISSDSDPEAGCLDEEVRLALDLFDRRSLPHGEADPFPDAADPFGFGVFDAVEEMSSDYLELGLGLGFRFGAEKPPEDGDRGDVVDLEDDGSEWDRDGFFGRSVVLESVGGGGELSGSWDGKSMRIVGFGLDSDSDDDELIAAVRPDSCDGDLPDRVADDLGLPLCWDCLHIEEERRDTNEDFEWEEVDGRVDEREVLSMVMDADGDRSVVLDGPNSDLELDEGEYEEEIHNIEWEVLLAMNNLERNVPFETEDAQSYLGEDHDDYVYASEYEVLFGQFTDQEISIKGSPPAAKSVVEHLPTVVVMHLDVAGHNTVCAVCKDEFSLEEKAKQLPCLHYYHTDCILPWLRIRNTCPVCRFELPTDDPDFESLRAQTDGSGGVLQ